MRVFPALSSLALAALLSPLAARSTEPVRVADAPAPAASAAAANGEPQVIDRITEDDLVRIEELRVRGQTRRLTVQPKVKGLAPYEIAPAEPGVDPAHDLKAGKRIWWQSTF